MRFVLFGFIGFSLVLLTHVTLALAGTGSVRMSHSSVIQIETELGFVDCAYVSGKKVPGTYSSASQSFLPTSVRLIKARSALKTAKQKHASPAKLSKITKLIASIRALLKVAVPACLAAAVPTPAPTPTPIPGTQPTPRANPTPTPSSSGGGNAANGQILFQQKCQGCHTYNQQRGRTAAAISASLSSVPSMLGIHLSTQQVQDIAAYLK